MDPGPVSLVYYSLCAAPGAAAGLILALSSRYGVSKKLIITIAGALGGIAGGAMVAAVPTQPGKGNDALLIIGLILFMAFCGWLLAFVATRLLRRGSA